MHLPLLLLLLPLLPLSHAQPQYPIPPPDAPYALVLLRIEGPTSTLFSSPVTTSAHNVTTPSSGTHICDGTNLHAHPSPGPTLTGALDSSGTPWDGTWYPPFEDFLITRVAGVPNTDTAYWGLLRNWRFAGVGGCQQRVGTGDELLVAWDAFSPGRLFLRAEVSRRAVGVGELVQVRVWDGVSGRLVGGAAVGGAVTGADGTVEVAFEERGVKRLKAEKEGCTRSNEVALYVY